MTSTTEEYYGKSHEHVNRMHNDCLPKKAETYESSGRSSQVPITKTEKNSNILNLLMFCRHIRPNNPILVERW